MKSFFIWSVSALVGALAGFVLSYFIQISYIILILAGAIVGSSAGFTINIHREKENDLVTFEEVVEQDEEVQLKSKDESDTNQKAS
jgi:hypothetical protein